MFDHDYVFVADEAGISNDRWTVVGGVSMHKSTVPLVLDAISKYREEYNMRSELKWNKISNQKQSEYEALVDYFFALNNVNQVQFHAIIFDSWKSDHKAYNGGDKDVGVSKLYYQLLLHRFVKRCGQHGSLYARLDARHSSTKLEDVRSMLNATARRDHAMPHNPLKMLVSEDSKKCDILQFNDVILGAVCAVRNGRHLLPGGRRAKKEVAAKVLEKSACGTFDKDTPIGRSNFTVWNMRSRPRRT